MAEIEIVEVESKGKSKLHSMHTVFGLLALGVILIFAPTLIVKVAVIIGGLYAIKNGVYSLVSVCPNIANEKSKKTAKTRAIISIIIGLVAVVLPLVLAGIVWTIMLYVLAVYFLSYAITEFGRLQRLKSAGIVDKVFTTDVIVGLVLALVLFLLPNEIGGTLLRIIGGILVVASSTLIFAVFKSR